MSIINQRKEALAKEILDAVDLVTFVASLDPTDWNQGEPAYGPEFQRLIVKAKTLHDIETGDAPLLRVRLNHESEPVDIDNGDVDVYVEMPTEDDVYVDTIQVKCTYEGIIIDVFRDSMALGTSSETWDEVHNRLRNA